MPGAGKSTIGRALSRRLGFGFVDLDRYIEEKEGMGPQGIIDELGERALILIERKRMMEIRLKGTVVAPGGSIVYSPGLMGYLGRNSVLVYLDDSLGNIRARLSDAPQRGIVGLRRKSLGELYIERRPLYSKYADVRVDCRGKTKGRIVEEAVRKVGPRLGSDLKLFN